MTPRRPPVQPSLFDPAAPVAGDGQRVFRCEVCKRVAALARDAVCCAVCGGQIEPK